jgi:hypothetical protein
MRRRDLILGAFAVLGWPLAARAQQKRVPVIGYLHLTSLDTNADDLAACRQGLSETGYIEGQNSRSNIAGRREAMIGFPDLRPSSSAARSI